MNWARTPLRAVYRRHEERDRPDLPILSVYRDWGVVPRDERNDNYNRPGEDLNSYKVVNPGDIVINKMKTWQGSIAVSSYEGIVSPAYFVGRKVANVENRFMHHLLRSQPLVAEYGARSKGIRPSQWDLPWDEFASIKVLLPPLPTQRAIADYLDAETARINALIEKKRRMVELLRDRRSDQISSTLWQGKFRAMRLKYLTGRPTSGNRDHGSFTPTDEGVPCLRGLNVRPGRIDRENLLRIAEADNRRHVATMLKVGDVVIVRSGLAGSAALVPEDLDGCNCVDLVIVRRCSRLLPEFLEYVLNSREAQEQVRKDSSGALLTHFNADDCAELIVPFRDLSDQERIVKELDTSVSTTLRTERSLTQQIDLLAEHRQALITAAVTGELPITGVAA